MFTGAGDSTSRAAGGEYAGDASGRLDGARGAGDDGSGAGLRADGADVASQGRGMLFVHDAPGRYPYWMYHCKIGLDIIWMDAGHRIVEISADTPPCRGKAASCPSYGGHETSLYVLELPVGSAKAHHLAVGEVVRFDAGS
ncbi:MAG: DUF192 domain-containing protein [Acidobacteriaceae bacterium]